MPYLLRRQARSMSHPPRRMKANPASPMKTVNASPTRKRVNATSVRFRFQRAANPMAQMMRMTPPSSLASGATAMEFFPALVTLFVEMK